MRLRRAVRHETVSCAATATMEEDGQKATKRTESEMDSEQGKAQKTNVEGKWEAAGSGQGARRGERGASERARSNTERKRQTSAALMAARS